MSGNTQTMLSQVKLFETISISGAFWVYLHIRMHDIYTNKLYIYIYCVYRKRDSMYNVSDCFGAYTYIHYYIYIYIY